MPFLATAPLIVQMVAGFFFSTALSVLSQHLFSKTPKGATAEQYGIQDNTRSSNTPIPIIYGQVRMGVNMCYVGNSGTDNKYLHYIGIIGEGEIEGFVQEEGVDQLFLDNKIYTEYGSGNVHYELFTGSSTQTVCTTLRDAVANNIGTQDWTWNDPLRYTAYIYLRLKWDPDKFQRSPNVTAILKGMKVYDPTADTTAYSNNPALCVNDFLTRSSRRGGFGIAQSRIDSTELEATRSYCATKGWTCNMPIYKDNAVIDNLGLLLNNFRGDVVYGATTFKIKYKDLNYESVVMSFDEDTIISKNNKSTLMISPPTLFDKPNTVNVTYYSEIGDSDGASTYKERTYSYSDNDAVTKDGDVREKDIECLGLTDLDNVQKMGNYLLERFRNDLRYSFTTGTRAAPLEPLDIVQVSHTLPGWVSKYSRVTAVGINPNDLTVSLNLEEEALDFYDDTYNSVIPVLYTTTLPDPSKEPSSVINVSNAETVYFYRGRSFTKWRVSFTAPLDSVDPFFDFARVYLKIDDGDYVYQTTSKDGHLVDPVKEGSTYYVKLISVNIFGTAQTEENAVITSKTIIGKTTVPTNMTYLIATASGDTLSVYGSVISDPDIDFYELRFNAWTGGVFFASNETPNFNKAGMKPGTFNVYCCPRDNSGNYASTPVSTAVTIFYPAGYTDQNTWSWDFSTGTFTNTEQDTYDGDDILKCSHTGDVLTGKWVSPEYDLGSVKTVKIWGDFLSVFIASSTTWGGIASASTTWADLADSDTKWYEIAAPDIAAILQAKLKVGTTSGTYTTEIDDFQVLAPEVSCRYVQIEIDITDPVLDANLYLLELNMKAAYWS